MSVADNFDNTLKFKNKEDTMYLSVINSKDAIMRPFKKLYTQRDWSTNLYNLDIEGSQPRKYSVYTNKVDFINKVDDIERANPKIIHYHLNKPEYNLNNRDIEKSYPSATNFKTKRVTNPLEPKYKFSEVESYPFEVPKFIRNQIDISDIKGSSPNISIYDMKRESIGEKVKNIKGAQCRIPYIRKNLGHFKYDYMDYSDVNNFVFKTSRKTNILDPIYIFKKEDSQKATYYGPITKSKPETKYPYYYKPALNLKIDDIKGTNPGSINYIKKFTGKNFEIDVSDIPKTNSGSLKKGMTTKRCINPLMPKYQYLGEIEEKMRCNGLIKLQKTPDSMPVISDNNKDNKKENEKNEENGGNYININKSQKLSNNNNNLVKSISNNKMNVEEKGQNLQIINDNNEKKQINDRLNKFKINRFNINLINKDKQLKKSNSSMNLMNHNIKLEDNNENNKKVVSFTPLLNSYKSDLINNNRPEFDTKIFGKKPDPFFGYSHDPILQSRENIERLKEIEKEKQEKEFNKRKYSQFRFNKDYNYITEEYKKNPNENNLLFISDNPNLIKTGQIKRKNVDDRYNYNFNNKGGLYKFKNKSNSMRELFPRKKEYPEQLDSFLNRNNLQKNIDERNRYFEQSYQ